MELKNLRGDLIGVAVKHDEYQTGEVRNIRNYEDMVFVEFGRAEVEKWVPIEDLLVDVDYYDDNPEHAVMSVKRALDI